jgi:hypothetical protein
MTKNIIKLVLVLNIILWMGILGCSSSSGTIGSSYSGNTSKGSKGCVTTRPSRTGRLQLVPCGSFNW